MQPTIFDIYILLVVRPSGVYFSCLFLRCVCNVYFSILSLKDQFLKHSFLKVFNQVA